MTNHVQLDGLLFSSGAPVLSVMNRILASFSVHTEVCSELGAALNTVTHRRLDAVIVDWNAAYNPTRVVSAARKSSPNATSTIVVMGNESAEMQAALLAGANFIIHKPTNQDTYGESTVIADKTENSHTVARITVTAYQRVLERHM